MTFMAFRLLQLVISCKPQPVIEKTGQIASRERFRQDAGQTGQKTGRHGKNLATQPLCWEGHRGTGRK